MKSNSNNLKGVSSVKTNPTNSNNNIKQSTIENNSKSRKEQKPRILEQNEVRLNLYRK